MTYTLVPPDGGKNYHWQNDHLFVKLNRINTNGEFSLIQDNLKPGFDLPMHVHRKHSETFYILSGKVSFTVDGDTFEMEEGAVLHVPAEVPHGASTVDGAKMLMIYLPAGFEEMMEEFSKMSEEQFQNQDLMKDLGEKYDNIMI